MRNNKIKMGLFSLILGVVVAISGSAFTTHHRDGELYGRTANNSWQLVGAREEGSSSGQYTCESASKACTATFASQPAQGATPDPDDIVENGVFTIH